ncbi:hypothetical protein H1164_16270 [Thermoactinomyces daqus]|uniref:Uncharacterized protein n=1 Tax=Thermoactinomyces daqus TaxID=1329516 RepID=A0A7W1XD77_9BACL|nr:hypothetical protein [Thermoactinomyces daqus]MBA4544402.1 hypothetical protein [Thermoactinomyces daqus]
MSEKETVIMSKINLNQRSSFSYHFYGDPEKAETVLTKIDDVEKKIKWFVNYIRYSLAKIQSELLDLWKKGHIEEKKAVLYLIEHYQIEKWMEEKGLAILHSLIKELQSKEFNDTEISYLESVLEHQIEIAVDFMISSRVSPVVKLDQIEILMNYIKELPFDLKFEMNLDSFTIKKVKIKQISIIDDLEFTRRFRFMNQNKECIGNKCKNYSIISRYDGENHEIRRVSFKNNLRRNMFGRIET